MFLTLLACSPSFYTQLRVEGASAGAALGKKPARIGDVDGDGVPDLAIRDVEGTLIFSGADFLGEQAPTVDQAIARLPLPEGLSFDDTAQQSGEVLGIGDVDQDGLADVVDAIGCRKPLECGEVGAVSLYLGSALLQDPIAPSLRRNLGTGEVIAVDSGDVDGDGVLDLAIATLDKAWVVSMGSSSTPSSVTIDGPHADLALVDLDSDGVDELALAQPDADEPKVVVLRWQDRRPAVLQTLYGPDGAWFGTSLTAIDLDHDGQEDLIISGARRRDLADEPEKMWQVRGRSLSLDGSDIDMDDFETASGLLRYASLDGSGLARNAGVFGHSLDACNDLDGDGLQDLLFAARPTVGVLQNNDGRIYGLSAPDTESNFQIWQHSPKAGWILYVSCPGDLDGDGLDEVLVGCPLSNQTELDGAGEMWLLRTGDSL